ncbi:MAG: MFS transporter [Candidatus Margulisiibacteriota bacterium]
MIASYYQLLKSSSYFFLFSISGVFFSAPGQTFLVSLAIPDICLMVNISPLFFATLYSSATLLASLLLPFIGKRIDILPAQKVVYFNAFFFAMALTIFAISTHWMSLFFALFLMRLFGQGALTLTATSHTIKCFSKNRGSALSITQLGYPLSEFIFPSIYLFLFYWVGLRWAFLMFAMAILVMYLPISILGLKFKKRQPLSIINQPSATSKTLKCVLRDPYFPIYLLISSVPPIMMTAALYFQVEIFNLKQWPITTIETAIFSYALLKFFSTIIFGPLIDRIGIVIPLTVLTLSIGVATLLISLKGTVFLGYLYYSLYGIGIGASASTMSYLWGLLYGSNHIGEIKGVIAIIRNGGTAVSPILFSYFLYAKHIAMPSLFLYAGVIIIFIGLLPMCLSYLDSRLT